LRDRTNVSVRRSETPIKAIRRESPERKAVDLNADAVDARRTDAAVAEVMQIRDGKFAGRRYVELTTRRGPFSFMDAENRCGLKTYGHTRRPVASAFECNFAHASDILDCHVAAILVPFRSRGIG
jgi:hypothetical protein